MKQETPLATSVEVAGATFPVEHAITSKQNTPEPELAAGTERPKSGMSLRRPGMRTQALLGVKVYGCGAYAPANVVTNEVLQARFGFDPEWILQRTGISERRWVNPGEATSDLSVEAARRAIEAANISPEEIDLVIVGTLSPDHSFPSTACLVQDRLGLEAAAFDLQAGCSGFMYTLTTASQFVANGTARYALAIGADVCSKFLNTADQKSAPLFGDGAGAVVVGPGDPHQGLICYQLGADGAGGNFIYRPACGSRNAVTSDDLSKGNQYLHMDGRNVFKWAVRTVTESVELMLTKTGMSVHDVSLFLFHQANMRIIDAVAEQLGIPHDKMINNLARYGNTSAASIPLVLDEAMKGNRIHSGDTVLMCGFGTGLTWGTGLIRW